MKEVKRMKNNECDAVDNGKENVLSDCCGDEIESSIETAVESVEELNVDNKEENVRDGVGKNESNTSDKTKKYYKIKLKVPEKNNTLIVQLIDSHDIRKIYELKERIPSLPSQYKIKLLKLLMFKLKECTGDLNIKILKIVNVLIKESEELKFCRVFKGLICDLRNILRNGSVGLDRIVYLERKLKECKNLSLEPKNQK